MAYGTKYECIAYDRLNNRVGIYIQKLDYSGAILKMVLDADPLEIKYNREKRVYGTGAIVNILNDFDDKYLFAKMLAEPYETYKLKVVSMGDGSIIFEGFLLPQTFNQDVRYKSYVALTFGNGLRMLENITPSFLTTGTDDYVTEMAILINIFSYLNLDYTIYVNSTLYEDSMSEGERADNPLKATYLNRLAFQQNDGEWDDALTILNKILTSINADCYIRGERIMIERFVDRDNNPKTLWTYNPVTEAHSSTEETFTDKTLDYIVLSAKSFRYQVDQPIKKLKIKLNALQFMNIFSNDFDKNIEDDSSPYTLHYWSYSTYTNIIDTDFSNSFITRGINITRYAALHTWSQFLLNGYILYKGSLTNKNDLVKLSLSYKAWKQVGAGLTIDFRYKVILISQDSGTTYYINANSDLQEGSYLFHHELTNNESSINQFKFEISNEFDLSGKLNSIGLDGDLFVIVKVLPPDMAQDQVDVIYGDFVLSQADTRINNLLEANINNDAFKTIEEDLDLYDAGFINYQAQKVLSTANGYLITGSWTDNIAINDSKSLQNHYILNRGNLYNSSCAILNMTVIDSDVEVNIDDIFVFNNLVDDLGNPMKFYVDDLSFNVKKHIYNIKLKQWLANVGKEIA